MGEIYTVANLGCFPSFKEPFGLVFVECMACGAPVIGANSGGPKDFVNDNVGCLVDEPGSYDPPDIEILSQSLNEAITKALTEDWKKSKGPAAVALAKAKFGVENQVTAMLKAVR